MTEFTPARVLQIELAQPLQDIASRDARTDQVYRRAISLVRLHTQPLGVVEVMLGENGLDAASLAKEIGRVLHSEINAHLSQDGLPQSGCLTAAGLPTCGLAKCAQDHQALLDNSPFVSIIVATRDRTIRLATCLNSLQALEYPNYEIIVVDNAPSTHATADFIQQEYGNSKRVRYVREDQPGLAVAHNRGLVEVEAPLVAFTDDDVIADRHWLTELVKGFNTVENVACVTGMIFAAEMESPAQEWIEQFGFNKGFARRVFDLSENRSGDPLYPYTAGVFGSGANMAFQTSFLQQIGGFDPALGAGSVAMGGDDLAAFFEVITRGYRLVYEPAAFVCHYHRRDYAGLRRQAYSYGVGLTAYLTKTLIDRPGRIVSLVTKMPYGFARMLNPRTSRGVQRRDLPTELIGIERRGMLAGPFAYVRSRLGSHRQIQQSHADCQSRSRIPRHD